MPPNRNTMESFRGKLEGMKEAQEAAEAAERDRLAAEEAESKIVIGASPESKELGQLETLAEQLKERVGELHGQHTQTQDIMREAARFVKTKGDKLSEEARLKYEEMALEASDLKSRYEQVLEDWEDVKRRIAKQRIRR